MLQALEFNAYVKPSGGVIQNTVNVSGWLSGPPGQIPQKIKICIGVGFWPCQIIPQCRSKVALLTWDVLRVFLAMSHSRTSLGDGCDDFRQPAAP